MKKGITLVFLLVSTLTFGQNNLACKYDELFSNKRIGFEGLEGKKLIANYLSDVDNPLTLDNVKKVVSHKGVLLNDHCAVDLFEVALANVPTVLKSKYLIVVNHNTKELYKLNIDYVFLVKVSPKLTASYLAVIDNFRGNFKLLIYKHSAKKLVPIFVKNIIENKDCSPYKPGSLTFESKDLNRDGRLDILVSYKEVIFCDKDGNTHESALGERIIKKKIFFKPNSRSGYWE